MYGQARDVREQDEFLAFVISDAPDCGEEFNACVRVVVSEPDFTHEVMQMPGQGLDDLLQAPGPGFCRRTSTTVFTSFCSTAAYSGLLLVSGMLCSCCSYEGMVRCGKGDWGPSQGSRRSAFQEAPGVFAAQCCLEEAGEVLGSDGARVRCRYGRLDDGGGFGDPVRGEPIVRQSCGCVQAFAEFLESGQCVGGPESCGDASLGVGSIGGVEREDVGQYGGVGLGMGEIEGAAQDVADFVVQPGAGGCERDGGEVGAVQGLFAPLGTCGVFGDEGQAVAEGADAFGAEGCVDGVGAGAHMESMQWAMPFRPEATDMATGRARVSAAS